MPAYNTQPSLPELSDEEFMKMLQQEIEELGPAVSSNLFIVFVRGWLC